MQPQFKEVRIENTNRCGYRCVMCPRDKHSRNQGVMPIEDFRLILSRIGSSFEGEMHLHGFGEPLLDSSLPQKIALALQTVPKVRPVIFSTLGVSVKESFLIDLVNSGLNAIFVSCYGYNAVDYKKVHGKNLFHLVKKNLQILASIRKASKNNLKIWLIPASDSMLRVLSSKKENKERFAEWMEFLDIPFAPERRLHNYGDGRQYNIPKKDRICPVIRERRRSVLQITWDLQVIPCCYDYNASIVFGNLRCSTLKEIFSGKAYFKFVLDHLNNNLDSYKVCQNCEKV